MINTIIEKGYTSMYAEKKNGVYWITSVYDSGSEGESVTISVNVQELDLIIKALNDVRRTETS